MKLIKSFKSPNFDERKDGHKLMYIILHYTAMKNCHEAIQHMCENTNKVSAHFLISKNGDIYNLVDLQKRAWHAGESYWRGSRDLNSSSIGIEIDNSGFHLNNEKFSNLQIKALCFLAKKLIKKYNISHHNILGHSDIAPYRKIDPGKKFPWQKLNKAKLSYFPLIDTKKKINKINIFSENYIKDNSSENALKMLKKIGYDTKHAQKNDKMYKFLIQAYQMHYRQSNISGKIDLETHKLISKHYKDILT